MKHSPSQSVDAQNSLTAIQMWGFDGALRVAFAKALRLISEENTAAMALHWLELSQQFLKRSRLFEDSPALRDQQHTLYLFYWKLAHQIYWHQVKTQGIAPICGFIQLV